MEEEYEPAVDPAAKSELTKYKRKLEESKKQTQLELEKLHEDYETARKKVYKRQKSRDMDIPNLIDFRKAHPSKTELKRLEVVQKLVNLGWHTVLPKNEFYLHKTWYIAIGKKGFPFTILTYSKGKPVFPPECVNLQRLGFAIRTDYKTRKN